MRPFELVWLAVVATFVCGSASLCAGDRYALVIGVHQYDKNQLRNLPYAESDAVLVSEKLKAIGFRRVVVMTQSAGAKEARFLPTAANVRAAVDGFLDPRKWNEDDTAVVLLSGHGVQFRGKDTSYFCPMDARLEKPETLVEIQEVYRKLEKCPAGFKLLIADCCRNDPQSDFSRARAEVNLESVTRPQRAKPPGGVAAFFSCSAGEKAYESPELKKGIFTHFLLESLSDSKADLDKDGKVDLDEVVRFTKRNVTDYVSDQFGESTIQVPELVGKTRGIVPIVEFVPRSKTPALSAGSKAGQEWDANGLKMKFCWCPDGSYVMGSPKTEKDRLGNLENQVDVRLTGFWMGKYEVTQSEWNQVMQQTLDELSKKASPQAFIAGQGPRHPVYFVSAEDAEEFCSRLTKSERTAGRLPADWEYRLPTEAQWEYACRADTKTATSFGDKLDTRQANFRGDFPYNGAPSGPDRKAAVEVGGFKANDWGLHDMHGNVWERCRDWYHSKLSGGLDPVNTEPSETGRIIRGGCWASAGDRCRSALRGVAGRGGERTGVIGFRVVIERTAARP